MRRIVDNYLKNWKTSPTRKPLIIRGARQIGKTSTVRHFGKHFSHFVEINFEASTQCHNLFSGDLSPQQLLIDLGLLFNQKIIPGETLLFFDEIQACPRALIALRYFYEKMPELHLIAAGSLLEFAIDEVGIPVGRVQFLYMYPMSFIEFMWALGNELLVDAILNTSPLTPLHAMVHTKLNRLVGEYIAIGGMPEAVALWRDTHEYTRCLEVHHDLLTAFKQDFQKYSRGTQIKYVEQLFQYAPHQVGQVFRYNRIPGEFRKRELMPALSLLMQANIVIAVKQTAAQGLPLGAQVNLEKFKLIMVDVALTQALLGLTSSAWILDLEKNFINKGMIAEAFIGQEILAYSQLRQPETLYYWHREQPTSQAEVDYLLVKENKIIPVEVKAGKGSTLRSMHAFLHAHPDLTYGIRFSTQNYSIYEKIHSYPLYAVAQILLRQE